MTVHRFVPAPHAGTTQEIARLRAFPYPYRAMLAVCSDLDLTPDRTTYLNSMRFLNTTQFVEGMGEGVGLETGNTLYFDMAPDQFAYWNTDDAGRSMARELIRSGHVDCLHSFGDLATTREHAGRALEELDRHQCRMAVWIDHAVAPTNFGADIMCGTGDVKGAPAYHADLTIPFGIRYVWRGRVTSVTGQDVPRRVSGIFDPRHPRASAATLAREIVKGALAGRAGGKYAMHGPNRVLRESTLRDGQPVLEFMRSNPHWGGVSTGDTAMGIAEVLTPAMLRRLVDRGGTSIIYTHLGKCRNPSEPFDAAARSAFRRLADMQSAGQLLVTTTRRLLEYCDLRRRVSLAVRRDGGTLRLDVSTGRGHGMPSADGLTIYVPDAHRVEVFVDGIDVTPSITRNAPDATGTPSVSLRWPRLEFPAGM